MADRFGPLDWEAAATGWGAWTSAGSNTDTTTTALHGLISGTVEWDGGVLTEGYHDLSGAAKLTQVTFLLRFSTISMSLVGTGPTHANAAVVPLAFQTASGAATVGQFSVYWDGAAANLAFTLFDSAAGSVSTTDVEVTTDDTFRVSLTIYSPSGAVGRAHLKLRDHQGNTFESEISAANVIGQVQRILAANSGTASASAGDSIIAVIDDLEVRTEEFFDQLFADPDCYLCIREASQVTGYTQAGVALIAARNLLSAEYSYERQGGCTAGKFEIAIHGEDDKRYQGNALLNHLWYEGSGSDFTDWTNTVTGAGTVANHGDPYNLRSPYLTATDISADYAALYFSIATYDKTLVSGGSAIPMKTLRKDMRYRLRVWYRNEDADEVVGVRLRIINVTNSKEFSLTTDRFEDQSGFSAADNEFAYSATWSLAEVEFGTHQGWIQETDEWKIEIGTGSSPGSGTCELGIGDVELAALAPHHDFKRLEQIRNLGAVELWARHEMGEAAAHPYDAGVNSQYRRVYSGYLIGRQMEAGRVILCTEGYSRLLRDYQGTTEYSNQSIAYMVDDLVSGLVGAGKPFASESIGEVGDDPTDIEVVSFDADGKSLDGLFRDLAELVPGPVSWGVDADREFFFKYVANPMQAQAATDPETTVHTLDVGGSGQKYKRDVDMKDLVTKVTVYGERDEDTDIRPQATVENVRASGLYGERHREVIRDQITSAAECARAAQIYLAEKSSPRHKIQATIGPTRFGEIQRGQAMVPVRVRDGSRRGYRFASDGMVFSGALGGSLDFDSSDAQYATFTLSQSIGTSDAYFIQLRTFCESLGTGVTYTPFSNGTAAGNKFLAMVITQIASPDRTRINIYAGVSGTPTAWTSVWQHTAADTRYQTTTRWAIVKADGSSSGTIAVYADDGLLTPDSAATAFQHQIASSGPWALAARTTDSPEAGYYHNGKLDEFLVFVRAYDSTKDGAGLSRMSRGRGKSCIGWVGLDEGSQPYLWKDDQSNWGKLTLAGSAALPVQDFQLCHASGTGRRWGGGQSYGSYPVMIPEKIIYRWLGSAGWEQAYEFGAYAPSLPAVMDEFERELDRLKEVQAR